MSNQSQPPSMSFWTPLLRKTTASLSLCAALCLLGCQTRYESGLNDLAQDRLYDAERQARYGIKEDPKDNRYHLLLARSLVRQAFANPKDPDMKKIRQALPHAQKAFVDKNLKADAGRILGKIHWEMGKPINAVDAWREARAADPKSIGNVDYFYGLRTALTTAMTFEDYDKALTLRKELKAISTKHPELLDASKGKITPNEVTNVKEAISDQAFHDTLEAMAQDLERNNKFTEALVAYGKLIESKPNKADYYFARGRLLLRTGKEEEAKRAFRDFASQGTKPKSDIYIKRLQQIAEHVERRGVRGLALDFYKELLEALPSKPSIQRANYIKRLAQIHYALNERKDGRKYTRDYLQELKNMSGNKPLSVDRYLDTVNIAIGSDQTIVDSILEQALKEAPPNLRIAERLANGYARRASNGDVERVWKTYTSRKNNSRDALQHAGNWARRRRNYDLAAFFFEKLAKLPNSSSYDWYYLAQIYARQGKVEDLKGAVNKYLSKAGTTRRSLRDAASIYTEQNMYDEAEKIYKKAQKAYSDDMTIADNFARLYIKWGKPQSVHNVYKVWLKARGNQSDDFLHIGNWFMRQGREDEALTYLQKASKQGDLQSLLQIANVYSRQQRDIELRQTLDRYLKRHTHRPTALRAVLRYYRSARMNDEAAKVLEELIALNPNNTYQYEQLIEIYLQQGRDDDITKLLKAYIKQTNYPMRRLEQIARRLGYRGYSKAMLRFYQDMLQSQKKPDPKIYRLIGDSFYNMYSRRYYRSYRYRRYRRSPYYNPYRAQNKSSSNANLKKAKHFYEEYFKKASLKSSQLYDFAYQMRSKQFWKLSAMAYERIIKTTKRPRNNTYLDYGQVLFNLGESIKGEEMIKRYYSSARLRSDSYAMRAADFLMRYRRYEAAETYLQRIMRSKSRSYSRRAFQRLAEIYRQTDRQKQFRTLIEDYLKASSQPASARRTILSTLLQAGMWDLAVVQLEQMSKTQSDSRRIQLAETLFKAGKTERAKTVMNNYAANSTQPERAWVRVAMFYQGHALPKDAAKAFDKAVNASPDKPDARAARSLFLIEQGKHDKASKDIDKTLKALSPYKQGRYFDRIVTAFEQTGHYGMAKKYAMRALPLAMRNKQRFVNIIARSEFASGDPVRRDRMIAKLKAGGLRLGQLVQLLSAYGFHDAAVATIEEEVAVGDYVSASRVIMQHAKLFTKQGGIKRLMRSVQPLLDRTRPDASLENQLGVFLINEGAYEQGALYIRAALDRGITSNRMLLAHTYLKLKAYQEANKLFQAELISVSGLAQKKRLQNIATRYQVVGEHKRFDALLEHLVQDKRFVASATPLLIGRMIDNRAVLGAVNVASSIFKAKNPTKKNESINLFAADGLDEDEARELYLESIKIIASRGYVNEALVLLDQTPSEHRNDTSVKSLTVQLEAARNSGNISESIKNMSAVLESNLEDQRKLLSVARILMLSGHHEQAQEIAIKHLTHADFDISTGAFRVLAQSARATAQETKIDGWLKTYIDHNKDKVRAREKAASITSNLGLDNIALSQVRETAKRVPTSSYMQQYARYAYFAGSSKDFNKAIDTLWRIDYNPKRQLERYISSYGANAPGMIDAIIKPLKAISPNNSLLVLTNVRRAFQTGDVQKARTLTLAYLKSLNNDPLAIEETFRALMAEGLYVEVAKAIAPKLPKANISPTAHRDIGISLAKLGFTKDAQPHLDLYLKSLPDKATGQISLAQQLIDSQLYALALPLAEEAIKAHPKRPMGYLVRGMSNLGMGKTKGVEQDIDKALTEGIGRNAALIAVSQLAVANKQHKLATKYLNQLVSIPIPKSVEPDELMAGALAIWSKAKDTKAGIEFVEKHHPHILSSPATNIKVISALTNLYEHAGVHQRAYDIYQRQIQRQLIDNPNAEELSTYLNNLAYTYTTTNKNTDKAEKLIRLALSSDTRRRPSFIDTLGWVYYRQGKLAAAETEIRRAIRGASGSKSSNKELYEHLIIVLEARKQYATAAWLRAYISHDDKP